MSGEGKGGRGKGRDRRVAWVEVEESRSCGESDEWPSLQEGQHSRSSGGGQHSRSSGGASLRDPSPSPSEQSQYTQAPGDSEASDTEAGPGQTRSDDEGADAGAVPPAVAAKWVWVKKQRDTTPPAVAGETTPLRSAALNEREDVGNIGWFFGNWGQRAGGGQMGVQGNIDAQI